jgi:uncharacterized OB-fold protein
MFIEQLRMVSPFGELHADNIHRGRGYSTAFKEQGPYTLGLAELAEGPRAFAWIDKSVAEDHISLGMKMHLKATQLSNGNWTYVLTEIST